MLSLLPALLLMTPAQVSAADARPRLAVLALAHDDNVSPELADRLTATLQNNLQVQTRFRTVTGDELHTMVNPFGPNQRVSCVEQDCVQRVARETRASLVAFGRVRVEGGEPVLEGWVYNLANGRILTATSVRGAVALNREGSARLGSDMLRLAEASSGVGAPLWLSNPWFGVGVTMGAAGVASVILGAGTAAFASWVFMNSWLDTPTRQNGRLVAGAAMVGTGLAAVTAVAGIGGMTATVVLTE